MLLLLTTLVGTLDAEYEAFLGAHAKPRPADEAEYARRAATLHDNAHNVIPALNAAAADYGHGVEFALNQFGDLTAAEFKDRVLMPKRVAVAHGAGRTRAGSVLSATPDSFDWRDEGAVTPVKDQGTVGSCWAFSTVGNLEGQHFIGSNTSEQLSEEFLVDCDDKDCGVFGGWP